jgi:hypothetical protein
MMLVSMSGRSLAAHCWRLHQAAEGGNVTAGRRLERLGASGVRAGQAMIDLVMGWHRHRGQPGACDEACPEASDGEAWARAWEAWWPPGKHPGT